MRDKANAMLDQPVRPLSLSSKLSKVTLLEEPREGAIRVDLAWQLFFDSKPSIPEGHGRSLLGFTNWLWDELGKKTGNLNKNPLKEISVTLPTLSPQSLDFLLRIISFWSDEIRMYNSDVISENLWRKPVVNVFDDKHIDGAERSLHYQDDTGFERYMMPLLGPGHAFFRVQIVESGESAARFHSHSAIDEYYLILEGKGTLRFNDHEEEIKRGDLIAKPAGPDATSQLIADMGEPLRILDMEIWHERPYSSKDMVLNPDFNEIMMRGPGWASLTPAEALMMIDDFRKHYDEGYRRDRDGSWTPSKLRGHRKVREKTGQK